MGRGIERGRGKEGKAIKSNVFEALASAGNDKKNGAGGTRRSYMVLSFYVRRPLESIADSRILLLRLLTTSASTYSQFPFNVYKVPIPPYFELRPE